MTNHQLRDILLEIEKKKNLNLTEVADRCIIDRSYLSKIINMEDEKSLTKKMIVKLKAGLPDIFTGNNKNNNDPILKADVDIKLSDYIFLLKEKAIKAEERERAYQKLVEKTLETNNTSLHGLLIGQKSILAHLEVGFEKEAMMEAEGDKKKAAKIKDETGRRIVEVLEEALNSGSWVDRTHPGNQQEGA